ncbi:AAA family ATPase [Nocardia sp. NBC_01503]|uniref:AAA family ATPase n=1 Tax=Nocardia sp. NBC_01503 TaxID=2975997 RepID=UPI002E7B8F7D|nr:AAA family ATPase [Nocardia sp. NBC_01503]WTL33398.1 AAA family ATPase [Nocardia sp. NBC_01503]
MSDELTPEEEVQLERWWELQEAKKRFPTYTLAEAAAAAEEQDDWLVPGLIASTSTLVFGEAKIGKSWLIAHLIGALVSGGEFLNVQVPQGNYSIGVCYTDDAGHREYAQRLSTAVSGTDHAVTLYGLGIMKRADWDALHHVVTDAGHNVLIIDNLTQILDGSINEDDVIRRCFDGIRRFTQAGIPVVIVGHSSDAKGKSGYKPDRPMGSAAISQSVRWLMQVRHTRGGNLSVNTYGNIDHGRTMKIRADDGARFTVLETSEKTETVTNSRERSTQTLDRNQEHAQFVVRECQGVSLREAGRRLADKFSGDADTFKNSLGTKGKLSPLLNRTKAGNGWTWDLVEHR